MGKRVKRFRALGVEGSCDREQWRPSSTMLLKATLEVQGEWGKLALWAASAVILRMREVWLAGVKLLSDQQPSGLRVQNRTPGSPAIWLHNERDWSKLAYQFGHELGHVLANSWGPDSKPRPPCQWLEEDLVEAFSPRGPGKLADSWEQRPVFNDAPYANAVWQYQRGVIENYEKIAFQLDAGFRSGRLIS